MANLGNYNSISNINMWIYQYMMEENVLYEIISYYV